MGVFEMVVAIVTISVIGGVITNGSARIPALVAAVVDPLISPVIVYKIYVFIAAVMAPLAIVLGARLAGLGTAHGALAAARRIHHHIRKRPAALLGQLEAASPWFSMLPRPFFPAGP
jgi:hypothetical protein